MNALELQLFLADDMKLYKCRVGDVNIAVEVDVTEGVGSRREVMVGRKLGADGSAAVAEHCFYALALILCFHVVDVPVVVICFGNQIGEGLLKDLDGDRGVALADDVKHQMHNGDGGAV